MGVQAQFEVLNCIGIYIYERLHKVWYSWQVHTRTAPLLCWLSLECMKRNYETILMDKRGGIDRLYEEMIEEFAIEDGKKNDKRSKKKEKREKQKAKKLEKIKELKI